jgi:hypothetical protein
MKDLDELLNDHWVIKVGCSNFAISREDASQLRIALEMSELEENFYRHFSFIDPVSNQETTVMLKDIRYIIHRTKEGRDREDYFNNLVKEEEGF